MSKQLTLALLCCLSLACCQTEASLGAGEPGTAQQFLAAGPLPLRGVNLAGAEFDADEQGNGDFPGTLGMNYIYPDPDYAPGYDTPTNFRQRGMTAFRLPFRWERLQPQLNAALDPDQLMLLTTTVQHLLAGGASVILDPHNYARYFGGVVGSAAVPDAAFADFWSRLATQWKDQPNVIFGLMNEPFDMPTEQWVSAANAALSAIRAAGAQNLVLVPGNDYTGAAGWHSNAYGTPNAQALLDIVDPGDNFAFDVHTYLNASGSGATPDCVSSTVGSEHMQGITSWLQQYGFRAVLTEFGGGSDPGCLAAIDDLLNHLEQHADVYLGWTYWAAGPWWQGMYPSIEPQAGQDTPQLSVLAQHLTGAVPGPGDAAIVYDDALAPGWHDWSWGLAADAQVAAPALGSQAFQITFGEASSFKLAHADAGDERPLAAGAYTHVVLQLNAQGPISGLQFQLGNGSSAVDIDDYATLLPNTWTEVRIPLSEANDQQRPFSFLELTGPAATSVAIDDIRLERPAAQPVGYERVARTLAVAGTDRSYVLARPAQPSAARLPLIIALHADRSNADAFRSGFALEQQVQGAAVVAYLESVQNSFEYWSLPGRQTEASFVQALIAALDAEGLIRTDRVFMTGLSGGATMTNALACMLGAGTLRAVGAMSGTLYATAAEFADPPACDLPPALIVWGESDAEEGTEFSSSGIETREKYRGNFSCPASAETHSVAPTPCVAYEGCSKPLTWCAVPGMGHAQWTEAASAIWSFFASQL
jgi:endoglucanase